MSAQSGRIYRDSSFYTDLDSGELRTKYFLVLAAPPATDIVIRLLTSRYASVRPEDPPCHHGDPYPGFFLGILGKALNQKTWLDLRKLDDLDPWDFKRDLTEGRITEVQSLPIDQFKAALACAASADDTTTRQERLIRDVLAGLG
jgi:hypothetical protein